MEQYNVSNDYSTANFSHTKNFLVFKHVSITLNQVAFNKTTKELSKIRTYSNYIGEVPKGYGQWIRFNITNMFSNWLHQMHFRKNYFAYDVFLKTMHPLARNLLALDLKTKTVIMIF